MNTISCIQSLWTNADFVQLLGWCFAAAIVIGGIIDESPKRLTNWIFAAIIFAVTEGVLRYVYRIHQGGFGNAFLCESNAITINVAITYIIGITIGWMIVYFGKKHVRNSYDRQTVSYTEENEETPQ